MNTTPSAATRPARSAILAIILVSYFMILLDNSIIFTALPAIHTSMGYSTTGLAVFAVASLLIGAAQTGWWLIAARALQGVGAAIVAPSALSLLTASFPEGRERAKAIALYGATAGIGASLGLVIGGALAGWSSPVTVTALVSGAVLMVVLVAGEGRAEQPIMPLRLFADRQRVGAYTARFGQALPLATGVVLTLLGMALGLGVLVAVSANSGSGLPSAAEVLTARVDTALLTGSLLLAGCLVAVLALVVPWTRRNRPAIDLNFVSRKRSNAETH